MDFVFLVSSAYGGGYAEENRYLTPETSKFYAFIWYHGRCDSMECGRFVTLLSPDLPVIIPQGQLRKEW